MRKIGVEIVGDSRSLERAFRRSTVTAKRFRRDIEGTFRGGLFGGAATQLAAFAGAAGAVGVLKQAVEGAADLNEQISKSNIVFADSAAEVEDWSKTLTNSFGLSERAALATASSFGALFRPLGFSAEKAAQFSEDLTQMGSDLAAFYNTDVQDALDAIQSGLVGQSRPLRRYGILLDANRVNLEAMAESGKKSAQQLSNQEKVQARINLIFRDGALAAGNFALTSDQLAQQQKILSANIEQVKDRLGEALIPVLEQVVTRLNAWLSNTENQQRVLDDFQQAIGVVTTVIGALRTALENLNRVTGSTKETVRLLFTALLAYKTLQLAAAFRTLAADIGLIGTSARGSRREVGRLQTALGRLSGTIVVVTILLEFKQSLQNLAHKIGIDINDSLLTDFLKGTRALGNKLIPPAREAGHKFGRGFAEGAADAAAGSPRVGATRHGAHRPIGGADTAGAGGGGGRRGLSKLVQNTIKRLELNIDRAGLTKTLADDLAAMRALESYLKQQIRIHGHVLELEQELVNVQSSINALIDQETSNAKQAADSRKEAARQRAEAARAARVARQFAVLGLGPTGEELIPNTESLRKRFRALQSRVKDLDPAARKFFNAIRKLLTGPWKKLEPEVRRAIDDFFDGIAESMKKTDLPIRKWKTLSVDRIAAALGLTPQQKRELSFLLAGGGLTAPPGRNPQFAGAGAGGGGVNVEGDVHIHGVTNWREFEHGITRRRKARPQQRRGAR